MHDRATNRARAHYVGKAAEREAEMIRFERIAMPVDVTDAMQFPNIAAAIRHVASLSDEQKGDWS